MLMEAPENETRAVAGASQLKPLLRRGGCFTLKIFGRLPLTHL